MIIPRSKYFLLEHRKFCFRTISFHRTSVDEVTSENLLPSFEKSKEYKIEPEENKGNM